MIKRSLRMGRLHRLSFLSTLIGPIYAEVFFPNCSAGWDWMDNSLKQTPCNVAAYLEASCNGGRFNIQPLLPGKMYGGTTTNQSQPCQCNTVVYSLVSACAACQGGSWILWSSWSANCTNVSSPSTYPNPIPSGTRVPHWAYLDVQASNNTWDITAAQSAGDPPEATPVSSSTIATSTIATSSTPSTPSATSLSSSSPISSPKKSHGGTIAGAIVGGFASASLLTAFAFWYLRSRRRRAEAQPSPFASRAQVFGLQEENDTPISIGRNFDPSDPSTFPKPFVSRSVSAIQTTSSSERVNTDSIRPYERSSYPGLPLV